MIELGKRPDFSQHGYRDALHISVIVCRVADRTWCDPGDKVKFTNDALDEVVKTDDSDFHGIADPFWDGGGEYLVVIVNPAFVTKLRHDFEINVTDVPEKGSPEDLLDCRFCG